MHGSQGFVVSGYHIAELLKHKENKIKTSLDLGLSYSEVTKDNSNVLFPDGQALSLGLLERISKRRRLQDCFLVKDNSLLYLYLFEDNTVYKLYEPHINWPPTLWINGSMMHTVSVSKPTEEAENKVKALGEISGKVLDTCFGLGYTAMELINRGADNVRTFELSESVLEIAKANPWSRSIFDEKRIRLENSDVYEAIKSIKDNEFDLILHDPPNVKIEGDLYSLAFYKELYRVIKSGGTVYHFVGGGRVPREYKVNYLRGVIKRLSEAGFRKVQRSYRGVVAVK